MKLSILVEMADAEWDSNARFAIRHSSFVI
jgi:hypothetical protein